MLQAVQLLTEQYDSMWEKLADRPNRVYFPNFGDGDNALKSGIDIDRVMFKIPGTNFQIYWYGFLIAVGIILAMIYGFKKMKKAGVDPDRATDAVIGGFFGAIIGARLYYIVFSDSTPITKFFDFRDGGLAIYGGLIGAILVGGIITKMKKLRLTTMLDITAPCFLIGQAIGRWGNFFNQEAFGTNTTLPWGMMSNTTANYISSHITDGSVDPLKPIHPCFLYESLWCLLGFIILHAYFKHRKFDGEVFLCYTAWYGLGRFFIEGLRTDSLYIGSVRVSQLLAAACFAVSVIAIIVVRVRIAKNKDYVFFKDTELSRVQLEQYESMKKFDKEKKELRKKIAEAENKGENTEELKKEFRDKFGKGRAAAMKKEIENAEKADAKAALARKKARLIDKAERRGDVVDDTDTETEVITEVKEKTEEVKAEVEEKTEEVKAEVEEKTEEVKAEVEEKTEEVKTEVEEKTEEVKAEVEEKTEEVKAEVEEKAEEVKAETEEKTNEAKTGTQNKQPQKKQGQNNNNRNNNKNRNNRNRNKKKGGQNRNKQGGSANKPKGNN
ncbi:MAG: prolipoprotein diacylglyceryl transferase [Ruminococcus sp.]|nr:prolipoprotein diacylglyceryl transferase [Ruminococcus sp.]